MKSYKTELDLNNKQRTACLKHAGVARFAYNWGLARRIQEYKETGKSSSAITQHKQLVVLKKTEFPWMYEVSKCAPQEALRNLDKAYKSFFHKCKSKSGKKGFPKFKSKKNGIGSFALFGAINTTAKTIQLPRIGIVRLKEHNYLPTDVLIISATVSEHAGKWFVSVSTKEEPSRPKGSEILGVDVGIKNLATLSDGTVFENPRALKHSEKKLRCLQKSISRKVKGSNNRKKAVSKLSKCYYRVTCIRNDSIHKATDVITKRCAVLGIESLNVVGMMKNHHLAKAVSDALMGEFLRQIQYKMKWSGGLIVKADPFYPSSKTCSDCGFVLDSLPLSVRAWICPRCGCVHDRDVNAARNLQKLAASFAASACGEASSGRFVTTKLASVKQEPNTIQGIVLNR